MAGEGTFDIELWLSVVDSSHNNINSAVLAAVASRHDESGRDDGSSAEMTSLFLEGGLPWGNSG